MHVRSAFFTVHCTKEWYLNFTMLVTSQVNVHICTHIYVQCTLCTYVDINCAQVHKFMYTGVIMPRIPAPPLIQGGSKYKIQYEFHVNKNTKYTMYCIYSPL